MSMNIWLNEGSRKEYFTEQYDQSFDYVYSYILARTAGNIQLAEEIVQDTFAAAWLALDSFDNRSSFRTWLCSIAKNKLRESYRKSIYKERFELLDNDNLVEYGSSFDLEQFELDNEKRQRVLKVLNEINPLYRYALIMKYMDGMSVNEIAKVLGRSAKAVDGVLQRSKAVFKKAYLMMEGCDDNHE